MPASHFVIFNFSVQWKIDRYDIHIQLKEWWSKEKKSNRHSGERKPCHCIAIQVFMSPLPCTFSMNDQNTKFCVSLSHCLSEYHLSHLFDTPVLYASITLAVQHLKPKKVGGWRKPFSKWTIWGCLGHVIDFCNVALKPSVHMDSTLIRYLLITKSEVFPVSACSHVSPGLRNPALWSWRLIGVVSQLIQCHCGHCMHRSDAAKVENLSKKGWGPWKKIKHHRKCMGWGGWQRRG